MPEAPKKVYPNTPSRTREHIKGYLIKLTYFKTRLLYKNHSKRKLIMSFLARLSHISPSFCWSIVFPHRPPRYAADMYAVSADWRRVPGHRLPSVTPARRMAHGPVGTQGGRCAISGPVSGRPGAPGRYRCGNVETNTSRPVGLMTSAASSDRGTN